ncbi:hypothetical protein [Roseiterribacter gracilis]|uniref:CBM-cenC domain-containing protein n=1 Tax=Roseiterribacter gracilis TaxID=2812848 RepID=A0A8S8XHE1_9PROT|nr:hypothetical protein TMPK1_35460 [Rhodospirillales bacterium TMPK1]
MERRHFLGLALSPVMLLAHPSGAAEINGWHMTGKAPTEYELSIDTQAPTPGGKSAKMRARTEKPSGFGAMMQLIKADSFRGARVKLTAMVKTEGAEVAGLWMRVDDERGSLSLDNMMERPISGTANWKQYAIVLDVPKESTAIAYGLILNGKGTAWATDFNFEPVGVETPVTGKSIPKRLPPASTPTAPVNPKFEQ